MNFIYGKTLATAGLLLLLSAFPVPQASAVEVEIPGLITNRTITPIGHDFYRLFSDKWQASQKINLSIQEKPSARWGSIITIKNEQNILFRTVLFPSRRNLEQVVDQAITVTSDNMAKILIDKALLKTSELAADEF
ncbi:MAG: curli production assembly/transport protein CsgE [Plesiomonas shigelloides]